jgi:putative oxidoreductase
MNAATINAQPAPRHIGAWTLQILVALVFFAAGGAKLAGVPYMVHLFSQIGIGQWFRVVTGLVEISGAIALVYPRLASLGGLWLAGTMFFGTLTHIFVLQTTPVPAIVLGLLNLAIVYLRRDELASLVRSLIKGA